MHNNKITQENGAHLNAVICYFPVVDDGDGVRAPADGHGANLNPGSVLRIELQDVVQGAVIVATCIVLY